MGYYTSYSLDIEAEKGHEGDIERFENDLKKEYGDSLDLTELIQFGGVYAKLYDINDSITVVSKKYPHLLVTLSGDGDDSWDKWEQRWKGEETEYVQAVITYPFTNKKLLSINAQ